MAFSSAPHEYNARSSLSLPFKVDIGLVVDDVLDTSILREKYAQLVQLWPLLGGRVLSQFDARRFQFGSNVDFESRTKTGKVASVLPFTWTGETQPEILSGDLASIDTEFFFNAPLASTATSTVRVTSLDDATLLGFRFVHSLCDGQSAYEIIKYFCELLSGRPIPGFSLPPDTLGARISDLVQQGTKESSAPSQLERSIFVTSKLRALQLHGRYLLLRVQELLSLSPKLTYRLIYLPGAWVDQLHRRAQKELDREYSSNHPDSKIQLTRNDIITAFYLKTVYGKRIAHNSDSPVDYVGPINYRGFIEPPAAGTYHIHNSIILFPCRLSEGGLQTHSITAIAARIRLATIQYRQPAAIKHEIRLFEDKVLAPAMQDLRGGTKWGTAMVSPWTTFDFTSLDFSGASRQGRKASVVFVNPNVPLVFGDYPSPMGITLKDGKGGYWLRGANTQRGWESFNHRARMNSLFPPGDP
ncbi:hypothetical protein BDW66DRAFT_153973 [Aspergillus desertorum]